MAYPMGFPPVTGAGEGVGFDVTGGGVGVEVPPLAPAWPVERRAYVTKTWLPMTCTAKGA